MQSFVRVIARVFFDQPANLLLAEIFVTILFDRIYLILYFFSDLILNIFRIKIMVDHLIECKALLIARVFFDQAANLLLTEIFVTILFIRIYLILYFK